MPVKILPRTINNALEEFAAPNPEWDSTVESHLKEVEAEPYHNKNTTTSWTLQKETPRHRHVLHLKLQGYEDHQIAEIVGYHPGYIPQICRAPWAMEYMAKMQQKAFGQKVTAMLEDAVAPAVARLMVEMDNPKAKPSERINAADKILDRLFGKAAQPVIHSENTDLSKLSDAEIAERLDQLKRS